MEDLGLAEEDPSILAYQPLAAETPLVNGKPEHPPVSGICPIPNFSIIFAPV